MEPLKLRYDTAYLKRLADKISAVEPDFNPAAFQTAVFDEHWDQRELKDRMHHIADRLHDHLPGPYPRQLKVLLQIGAGFGDFTGMFLPDFVERYGQNDWDRSLNALEVMTAWSSSEFAVRPFILQRPQAMAQHMLTWAHHPNHHVRRLASEGCRPRLPWACALPDFKADPGPILPILETLKADPEDYVRRSVANNLNDISKDHPDLVLDLAQTWLGVDPRTDWIVKHACRTLLKAGHPKAMALFGLAHPRDLVGAVHIQPNTDRLPLGATLDFQISLDIQKTAVLRLEYAVHFAKASGRTSRKVFKISEREHQPGLSRHARSHGFQDLTTRKHHPGEHQLDLIVNGVVLAHAHFTLTEADPHGIGV